MVPRQSQRNQRFLVMTQMIVTNQKNHQRRLQPQRLKLNQQQRSKLQAIQIAMILMKAKSQRNQLLKQHQPRLPQLKQPQLKRQLPRIQIAMTLMIQMGVRSQRLRLLQPRLPQQRLLLQPKRQQRKTSHQMKTQMMMTAMLKF